VTSRPAGAFVSILAVVACHPGEPDPGASRGSPLRPEASLSRRAEARPPVLVVGWDGADWQQLEPLMASGAMPNLGRLRDSASWGEIETEVPSLSPLLWTSMFTGVSPLEHRILDFTRFHPETGRREPIGRAERQAPAIWNLATWAGLSTHVLGVWATHPAEPVEGVLVSDRASRMTSAASQPPPGFVYPPEREDWGRSKVAEARRQTGFESLRAFLPWLTDEEYRRRAASNRKQDQPISMLHRVLVEKRIIEYLTGELLAGELPDLFLVHLQGTDTIGHVFSRFAPPQLASVADDEFARYREVPERYLKEIDALLGKWIAAVDLAGGSLVLVSDHGFHWREGRPEKLPNSGTATASRWHRKEGVWLVRAPGIAPGRGPRGGIRQLFPTLLSLTGLPAAKGAEIRPLGSVPPPVLPVFDYAALFRERQAERREAAAPQDSSATGVNDAPAELPEIAELRALGYIGASERDAAPDFAKASGSTRTAASFNNEGILLVAENRDAEARAAFEQAIRLEPELAAALANLSDLLFDANDFERADELLVRAMKCGLPQGASRVLGRAEGYRLAGMPSRIDALLAAAIEARPNEMQLWLQRGRARVQSGRCREAVVDLELATALAPNDAAVFATSGLAHLCAGDRAAARAALRRSLELEPGQPDVRKLLEEVELGQ
jgi:Flp pilus assembly protein TadD